MTHGNQSIYAGIEKGQSEKSGSTLLHSPYTIMNLFSSKGILEPPQNLLQGHHPLLHFHAHTLRPLSLPPYLLNPLTSLCDLFMTIPKVIVHHVASHERCKGEFNFGPEGFSRFFIFVETGIARDYILPIKLSGWTALAGRVITESACIFPYFNCGELKCSGS
jgi:hypothetical protein